MNLIKLLRMKVQTLGQFIIEKQTDFPFAKGERPDSLGNVMDLINNELGFKIGSENKKNSLGELKEIVITEIKNGKSVIIKRNKHGMYVECDNKIIDMQLYKGKWFVPKCLVPSN